MSDFFATSTKRKGLLPTVLEDLISARKRAKADLKKETDPFKRAVLDGRQLALKVCFTNWSHHPRLMFGCFTDQRKLSVRLYRSDNRQTALSCDIFQCHFVWPANDREDKAGSSSIPLSIRLLIISQEVEAEYNIANGHSHNAEVIYGDTDSVMVRFGPTDLVKVMALGQLLAVLFVNATNTASYRRERGR